MAIRTIIHGCFNPRAREGRDFCPSRPRRRSPRFNPRAREGRDQIFKNLLTDAAFQSTRPRGARLQGFDLFLDDLVSIHAPARGATPKIVKKSFPKTGFNPRAREGRDPAARMTTVQAETGFNPRAREGRDLVALNGVVNVFSKFQSTRPRGARHFPLATTAELISFNPRAREGRDKRKKDYRD